MTRCHIPKHRATFHVFHVLDLARRSCVGKACWWLVVDINRIQRRGGSLRLEVYFATCNIWKMMVIYWWKVGLGMRRFGCDVQCWRRIGKKRVLGLKYNVRFASNRSDPRSLGTCFGRTPSVISGQKWMRCLKDPASSASLPFSDTIYEFEKVGRGQSSFHHILKAWHPVSGKNRRNWMKTTWYLQ